MKYNKYATFRDYDIKEVLKFEITYVPFYLINIDDGSLKYSSKSLISTKLLEQLSVKPSLDTPLSNCVIIDFMAYARKVPKNKINEKGGNLLTFGD